MAAMAEKYSFIGIPFGVGYGVDCGILGWVLASPQYVGNALTAVDCAE